MTSPKSKFNPTEIAAILRDVTVTYDGYLTRALNHVDVEFRRGEVTGVIGAKGAGKSTALKILAGQISPTEGKVKVFGHSPRGVSKATVGYLSGKVDPAHPAGFVDRLLGRKRKASPAGRSVSRLAQAMLGNRDLLVLDDPFADLAAGELAEAKALICEMMGRGKTVVLSSDALMDVKDLCDRFVILHEGKVQAVGTLPELLSGGGAIRFLPAVLPGEIVERVLGVLRQEIQSPASSPSTANVPPENRQSNVVEPVDPLREMAKPAVGVARKPAAAKGDTIDHEKLEGLMKPPKAG